jgi:hypothetical protein
MVHSHQQAIGLHILPYASEVHRGTTGKIKDALAWLHIQCLYHIVPMACHRNGPL